jgi:quercetin dioxygenase-like cupin family protein
LQGQTLNATPSLLTVLLFLQQPAALADPISSEILAKGSTSWDGGRVEYAQGVAELTVQRIRVAAGGQALALPVHCHAVPLAAYVTSGSVRVVKPSGQEQSFHAGDAFIEVMSQWHQGVFVEDTELIVFYAGIAGAPISTQPGDDSIPADRCR